MNDIHSQKIKTGGDPRALPDYAALRDEVAKLSHPARPDIDWNRIEQLSLSLFRQNGVELQTTVWYTLARTRLSGLAGLNEGLAILQMLVTRQWGIMWPQPVHARMEILAGFSQRLQAMLRTFSLGYVDLPQVYQAERHLNAVLEVLARLELKNASQMSELYTFMHNASIRLENTDANRDDITAAVLPASSLNAVSQPSSEPFDALVYVIESEPAGQSVIHHSPASVTARPWKGFAAGMLTMFLICGAGGWGWQQLNPTISGPVPVEPTESALTELKLLSPLWRQHYGFALAARAKPDDSARLKAQWQDYIVGNALAPQSLTGWHQGMEGLQTLMQRLNALDERKGKYLTGSELKSMVFTIMQDFGRTVPVEEQLYLLSQEKNGAPLPAALLLQTDTHFNQLLNRYALIQQPSETP
ncbi:VasL domain-containing protein [Atlantibacter hermannii]|uniref:VasL domain-containing protein n=3 Tax=Atlantibacter hermannii TaxID=565 RepID=UPI003316F8CC